MKKVILVILAVAMIATMFTGCSAKVEGTVISCEEGRVVKNDGAKTMATYHIAKGNATQALLYNNISQMETQMYDVVVEYEGNQYTIETKTEYETGETIFFFLPTE